MADQPWLKFYINDWRGDPALQSCGLAARGLWIEMLTIMHEAEPRGHLLIRGNKLSNKQIANLVGGTTEAEVEELLKELGDAGVFSTKRNGIIFCRKMVKQELLSRKRAEAGKKGAQATHGEDGDLFDLLWQKGGTRNQKPETRKKKDIKKPANIDLVIDSWNTMAGQYNLGSVRTMSEKRKKALAGRIKDYGVDDIIEAIGLVPERPFLMGDNDRGWRADFDWLLRPNSVGAIVEGVKYMSGGKQSGWA